MRLVIAEKPSVAASIAKVIGANNKKDGYLEGNGFLVSWCLGHLAELVNPDVYDEKYKKWEYSSLPIIPEHWRYQVKPDVKQQFDVLKSLMNRPDVTEVVEATDAGREGELIFRLAYKLAGCKKPFSRMWISSMEETAIEDGFHNLKLGSEYDSIYESALCRQQADWLVGINGTRLFTVLYRGKVLKVGRVQTPTLAMIVERERAINGFVKKPYYMLSLEADGIQAVSEEYETRDIAEEDRNKCVGKPASVKSVTDEEKSIAPPKLYDLTSLQRDANKIFGFTAKQTLEYTQSLYEKKLVTYPRTDSRYLTDDMEQTAKDVIAACNVFDFISGLSFSHKGEIRRVLNTKKVTDHHAIIPALEIKKGIPAGLSDGESKVLCLITTRLLASTDKAHEYTARKAVIECGGTIFTANGKEVRENGFKAYEEALKAYFGIGGEKKPADDEDVGQMLSVSEGMTVNNPDISVLEKFTKPPARYTESSLLSAMERAGASEMNDDVERKGLGTPATRADIIEKLVHDGFVKREKKQMIPTEDGMNLIDVLPDIVKSPSLTADWENTLSEVSAGKASGKVFMQDIRNMVQRMVTDNSKPLDGKEGMFGTREAEILGKCPKCGKEVVRGKFGAFCKGKCGMSFSHALGKELSDTQIISLLEGKKTLVRGLKSKAGKTYDAYLVPDGIEDYRYRAKDGTERSGSRFKFSMEFAKRKNKSMER